MAVVVVDEDSEYPLEVPVADDQEPVEAFGADGAHESLGDGVRARRPDWRADDLDPFAAEDLVEASGELAVSITDQAVPAEEPAAEQPPVEEQAGEEQPTA